jgi:methyl-accepting chemotaxis protein
MKIGIRLALTFGVVIALLLAICVTVSMQMAAMDRISQAVVSEQVVKQKLVGQLKEGSYSIALMIYRSLDQLTSRARAAELQAIGVQVEKNQANYNALAASLSSDTERRAYEDLVRVRAAYSAQLKPVYAQLSANDSIGARQTLLGMSATQEATFAALDHYGDLQQKQMDDAVAAGASAYATARSVLWGFAAAIILAALTLCILVTRSIVEPLRRVVDGANALAKGDLSVRIDVSRHDETGRLADAVNRAIGQLSGIVGGVKANSHAISSATRQLTAGNTDLSQRTEEQASSLEETAASMEQLTATVKQNSDSARLASQLAQDARTTAGASSATIGDMVAVMNEISAQSQHIAGIVGTIEGIAFQTNILALNAAVEAARAGEQGRGFAVVATEVRSLAQRSATAAKEIKGVVESSVLKMQNGVALAERAGSTMSDLTGAVSRVTDIMGEIAAASLEQSAGIEQVNRAITQMDQVTQQNAALVEQSSAAALLVETQAEDLQVSMDAFTLTSDVRAVMVSAPALPKPRRMALRAIAVA